MGISKIDQFGLGSKVLKLKDEGHSFDIISKIISDEAGITISRGAVDRYLKKGQYDELHKL
ncbi:MAG: hypothetical protein JSW06_09380 [Thermoplasmatales archaeon]|nr:MAG: hypothetical protein JSW06_09380 [Thermoplasmatales archaeon]